MRSTLRALLFLAASAPALAAGGIGTLPAIVFVSRRPPPGSDGAIPGLGPRDRTLVTGGRLMIREASGKVRALLAEGSLDDVSDPSVSPDGKRIAFAAVAAPESAWRIWIAGVDGRGQAPVTRGDGAPDLSPLGGAAARFARTDDFDPCWVDDSTLCFASTRYPQRSQYDGGPVSNLFLVRLGGGRPWRLTSERNGAEEPAMDFRRGRIVFSRWWHNRWLATNEPPGITTDSTRALPRDTVNLWQAVEIAPDGSGERLVCGAAEPGAVGPGHGARARLGFMAYQPAILADGSIAGVYAANLGLSPASGGVGIQRFRPRLRPGVRLAGAIVDPAARAGYGSPSGLQPASACAPAPLPDGRVLCAYDPGGRGDFGIYAISPSGAIERVVDLPGTMELDPVAVTRVERASGLAARPASVPPELPPVSLADLLRSPRRFRFLDLDVFAPIPATADAPGGQPVPEGPVPAPGARIRFWALLARPAKEGGDSAVLVRESPVGQGGRVDVDGLPAEVPMFEQIVTPEGRVLATAHGPAHVAGLNAGSAGRTTRCIGCHLGHSARPAP